MAKRVRRFGQITEPVTPSEARERAKAALQHLHTCRFARCSRMLPERLLRTKVGVRVRSVSTERHVNHTLRRITVGTCEDVPLGLARFHVGRYVAM